MVLLNGISSSSLYPILLNSPIVIRFRLFAAELYTAGCDVSLKEGEKKILIQLKEKFMSTVRAPPSCMMIYSSNDNLKGISNFYLPSTIYSIFQF